MALLVSSLPLMLGTQVQIQMGVSLGGGLDVGHTNA